MKDKYEEITGKFKEKIPGVNEVEHTTLLHIEKFLLYLLLILALGLVSFNAFEDVQSKQNQDLRQDYNELSNKFEQLEDNYERLEEDYEELQKDYQSISKENQELRDQNQGLNKAVENYRDIPETPVISGIDYSLHGKEDKEDTARQIAIEHPNISVITPSGTGSMSPGISSKSMLIMTGTFDKQTLTPGTIVSYKPEDSESKILHRIHEVKDTLTGICYVTKGDSNLRDDGECVQPTQIKRVAIGLIFRETGTYKYCEEPMQYPPSTNLCPG